MREANQPMAEVALNLYRECLRKVLMQRGGYECQETEGSFMLSFYNCIDAVQFCILVRHLLVTISSMDDDAKQELSVGVTHGSDPNQMA